MRPHILNTGAKAGFIITLIYYLGLPFAGGSMSNGLPTTGEIVNQTVSFVPNLIAAIIILIIGWIVGRLLGKAVAVFLDRIHADDAIRKSSLGKWIEQSGVSIVKFFDLIVRWAIYLIAILAAVNVLNIPALTAVVAAIIAYIPNIIAFVLIIIIGFMLIDWFADYLSGFGERSQVQMMGFVVLFLRVFLYFIVILLALQQLLIDLTPIYIFLEPLAWGVALGIGAAIAIIVGFGLRDRAPEYMDSVIGRTKKE
jgi:small-conductance mechanosensitive channel